MKIVPCSMCIQYDTVVENILYMYISSINRSKYDSLFCSTNGILQYFTNFENELALKVLKIIIQREISPVHTYIEDPTDKIASLIFLEEKNLIISSSISKNYITIWVYNFNKNQNIK